MPLRRPKLDLQGTALCNDDPAFDDMLQFPNVSRPVVCHKLGQRRPIEARNGPTEPTRNLFQKVIDQKRDVFFALTQRWDGNRKDTQPIIQVGSESSGCALSRTPSFSVIIDRLGSRIFGT